MLIASGIEIGNTFRPVRSGAVQKTWKGIIIVIIIISEFSLCTH
jgi:hypothetical protein